MAEKHEDEALDTGLVRRTALIGMTVLLMTLGLGYLYWRALFPPPPPLAASEIPPPPRLQRRAPQDLARLRATQALQLDRYAWVDRSAGVAQVPVERAMALLAQQGRQLDAGTPP